MSSNHCLWCGTTWPTLRPCCSADFEHLCARDELMQRAVRGHLWPNARQVGAITRDPNIPEIGDFPKWGQPYVAPDNDTEMDQE